MFGPIASVVLSLLLASFCSAEPTRLEEIKNILTERGYVLPEERYLADILTAEVRAGRSLSPREVVWKVQEVLRSAGGDLKLKSPRCFTCSMRVLTPSGYQALSDLREGDEISSWDIARGAVVINQITKIVNLSDQLYGSLSNTPTNRALEVTPDHQFYLPALSAFQAIAMVDADEKLLALAIDKDANCEALLHPRGPYEVVGVDDTIALTVKLAPHNYIVEGLVVEHESAF
jgi:hypothetical protein